MRFSSKRLVAWGCASLLALAVLCPQPVAAQVENPDQLIFTVSNELLEKILTKKGMTFQKVVQKVGAVDLTMYTVKMPSGFAAAISSFNGSLLGSASGFKTQTNQLPSQEKMTLWNQTKMFSRAFHDRTGSATVQSDMLWTGGTTVRIIEAWLDRFNVTLTEFGKHCW